MQQNLREKTKYILFKILNQCARDGESKNYRSDNNAHGIDRRKDQGSLKQPPATNRSRH